MKITKSIFRYTIYIIAIFCIVFGLSIYFQPMIETEVLNYKTTQYIKDCQKEATEIEQKKDTRFAIASDYNDNLYKGGQEKVKDAWDYESVPEAIADLKEDSFGYIEIPKMDTRLALYLGASKENLKKGAAILSGTSLPIGTTDSNSVIAAHRGYQGIPYFRQIEDLELGDKVYITNPWETLTYLVTKIEVVEPTDCDKLWIQEGKDMITLLTCHPYASHGKQRYLVYCERESEQVVLQKENDVRIVNQNTFISSTPEIKQEDMVWKLTSAVLSLLFLTLMVSFIISICKERSKKL